MSHVENVFGRIPDARARETGESFMSTTNAARDTDGNRRDLLDHLELTALSTEAGDGLWQAAEIQGERQLLVALLEEAIRSYQKHAFADGRRGQRLFREVSEWFTGPAHPDVAVPFEFVCDVLQIDADFVRSSLERWRHRVVAADRSAAA
jgi:hypothetical protein